MRAAALAMDTEDLSPCSPFPAVLRWVLGFLWVLSNLKLFFPQETMNPKDIMTDAIHNFHPQYQQYTQYSSGWFFLSTFSTLKPKISLCRVCGMFRSFLRACQILSYLLCFVALI